MDTGACAEVLNIFTVLTKPGKTAGSKGKVSSTLPALPVIKEGDAD
jgi:hypothetical protein